MHKFKKTYICAVNILILKDMYEIIGKITVWGSCIFTVLWILYVIIHKIQKQKKRKEEIKN